MISYDDATSFGQFIRFWIICSLEKLIVSFSFRRRSIAAKGKFIDDNGLAGFAVWQIAGDSDNILLSAISDAMGIVQVCSDGS